MLGELLFESKGKITDQRILSVENGIPKQEISVTGTGTFTGSLVEFCARCKCIFSLIFDFISEVISLGFIA
jgi:hypothetical protein